MLHLLRYADDLVDREVSIVLNWREERDGGSRRDGRGYGTQLFFVFFLSRGGSLSACITRAEALGTTSTVAFLFWTTSLTVTLSPFQSWVALAMSSPTFLGDWWNLDVKGS